MNGAIITRWDDFRPILTVFGAPDLIGMLHKCIYTLTRLNIPYFYRLVRTELE